MPDVELLRLEDQVRLWLDRLEHMFDAPWAEGPLPFPVAPLDEATDDDLHGILLDASATASWLPHVLAPSGRALVTSDPAFAWVVACCYALDVAADGVDVAIACPHDPIALTQLLVSAATALPWSPLEQGRLKEAAWHTLTTSLGSGWFRHVTVVRAGTDSCDRALGLLNGGHVHLAVGHPDAEPALGRLRQPGRYLHPVVGSWPGHTSLRDAAGVTGLFDDQLLGVGLTLPRDGVLIIEADPPGDSRRHSTM